MGVVTDFIFLGSKITVDVDYSHEIKRCLLLGGKTITKLDKLLIRRDINLPTNTPLFMGFPRQKHWCRLPFPSLGDPSNPGTESLSSENNAKFCGTLLMEERNAFQKPSSLNNMKWKSRVIWKLETNCKASLNCSQNTFLGKYHLTRDLEEQGFPGGSVIKNPSAM